MNRKYLLIGISAAAFAAGTASAQNTQSGNCSPTTNSGTSTAGGNSCTLTRGAGADADSSTINVTGAANTVSVTQNGIFDTSIVTINGNNNTVTHVQNGNFDFANTGITGDRNTSDIRQDGNRMSATVTINGNRNSSTVQQGTAGIGGTNGNNNTASVTIAGNNIQSQVIQNAGATATSNNSALLNLATSEAVATAGTFNQSATILQFQNGNSATVFIRGGGTGTAVSRNDVLIRQENLLFRDNGSGGFTAGTPDASNNPNTGNVGDVSVSGQGNSVTVNQDGVLNFASASVARGGTDTSTGAAFNGLAAPAGRREGNALTVNQDGRNLSALISVGGRDAAGFQGRGNIGTINQGQGTATTFQPTPNPFFDPIAGAGPGNMPTQNTETNAAATATAPGRGHSATLFQFGVLSNVTINQDNNVSNSGTGANAGGVQNGSTADVAQSAFASTVTLNQLGTNSATISQGGDVAGSISGNNTFRASQVDAGDNANPADPDPFGGSTGFTTQRNTLAASQAGRFNSVTVRQNGTNVSATVFQRRGSSSATIELNQGAATGFGIGTGGTTTGTTAGAAGNMTANIEQGGSANSAGTRPVSIQVRQDGNFLNATVQQNSNETGVGSGTSIGISQVGLRNSTTVVQTGSNAIATVDQRGRNDVAGSTLTNNVTVTQQGGTFGTQSYGNRAVVRQFESAGVSTAAAGSATTGGTTDTTGEASATRSGSQSAEAVIFQSVEGGTTDATTTGNNSATIEQNALGVYAEIDQRGRNNTAGIRQNAGANNSVAIIRQTGNANSFFITQSSPNQFFRVVQSGGGNQVTTGTGTNGGFTSNAAFTPTTAPTAPGGF